MKVTSRGSASRAGFKRCYDEQNIVDVAANLSEKVIQEDETPHLDVDANQSKSFQVFRDGVIRLVGEV